MSGVPLHHAAVCVSDMDRSIAFYRDGLGLAVVLDATFDGDWPTLFAAPSRRLRSVMLGDPAGAGHGLVELVAFADADAVGTGAPSPAPTTGFFLLSFFVALEETVGRLDALGFGPIVRIDQPAPHGSVAMATVRDPDGVLVELIGLGPNDAKPPGIPS